MGSARRCRRLGGPGAWRSRRRSTAAPLALLGVLVGWLVLGCAPGPGADTATAVSDTASSAKAGCSAPSPSTPGAAESRLPLRSLCALPPEAAATWQKIKTGAPLPYPRDGGVFGNLERLLPAHERGYYHEYTVPTPGERDRGARRLITGNGRELYYTGDHYRSFVVVDPAR